MPKKFDFQRALFFEIYKWMYTNSLGQYFDKLSLNAVSYQTADITIFVCISIEPGLKYLKITSS